MVVDDSAVVRGLITRILESESAIKVVASVSNGEQAVKTIGRHAVDVVILDIEMPVMDGLTALPKILAASPRSKIIMASTLTQKNAEVSMRALELGATDYIPKPTSSREIGGASDFKTDLIQKVIALGREVARQRPSGPRPAAAAARAPAALAPGSKETIALRPISRDVPKILAIGSSTGGPQALFKVLSGLRPFPLPVVITQHMPTTFTAILAQHITRMTGWEAKEAEEGDAVKAGRVLVAPGDFHMVLKGRDPDVKVTLNQEPPENFCRPSVDPMFRSVAAIYGSRALSVILTGMGRDGTEGGKVIVGAGGTVVVQDEATSVVWGMPGAAAQAGICAAVLPLEEIAPKIQKIARGLR
ncbi:MAG: protein-glutamate methylesterase/protein-glutamine glutaminase [Magnetospiraceae bacterium]